MTSPLCDLVGNLVYQYHGAVCQIVQMTPRVIILSAGCIGLAFSDLALMPPRMQSGEHSVAHGV